MHRLEEAFGHPDPSVRLKAVLSAGIEASPNDLDALVERCAIEPDFQVREMLTWALIRLPRDFVVPRLLAELASPAAQARQQALHTLSKIKDESTWPEVAARLDDPEPSVMRTAWYASVAVAPESEREGLARRLIERLGQGDRDMQLSLSRALVALGPEIVAPLLAEAGRDDAARRHAEATQRLLEDPGGRIHAVARGRAPRGGDGPDAVDEGIERQGGTRLRLQTAHAFRIFAARRRSQHRPTPVRFVFDRARNGAKASPQRYAAVMHNFGDSKWSGWAT